MELQDVHDAFAAWREAQGGNAPVELAARRRLLALVDELERGVAVLPVLPQDSPQIAEPARLQMLIDTIRDALRVAAQAAAVQEQQRVDAVSAFPPDSGRVVAALARRAAVGELAGDLVFSLHRTSDGYEATYRLNGTGPLEPGKVAVEHRVVIVLDHTGDPIAASLQHVAVRVAHPGPLADCVSPIKGARLADDRLHWHVQPLARGPQPLDVERLAAVFERVWDALSPALSWRGTLRAAVAAFARPLPTDLPALVAAHAAEIFARFPPASPLSDPAVWCDPRVEARFEEGEPLRLVITSEAFDGSSTAVAQALTQFLLQHLRRDVVVIVNGVSELGRVPFGPSIEGSLSDAEALIAALVRRISRQYLESDPIVGGTDEGLIEVEFVIDDTDEDLFAGNSWTGLSYLLTIRLSRTLDLVDASLRQYTKLGAEGRLYRKPAAVPVDAAAFVSALDAMWAWQYPDGSVTWETEVHPIARTFPRD